jgi:hypothetical protein
LSSGRRILPSRTAAIIETTIEVYVAPSQLGTA